MIISKITPHGREPKICLVSSSGGHLIKTFLLNKWWSRYQRYWVTRNDDFSRTLLAGEKYYHGFFPENRQPIKALLNFLLAIWTLVKNRPTVVFSTGAGIAPPFFWVAKLLGIKTIFLETFVFIPKATLSGKLIYPLCDLFLVQHPELLRIYPKAKLVEPHL